GDGSRPANDAAGALGVGGGEDHRGSGGDGDIACIGDSTAQRDGGVGNSHGAAGIDRNGGSGGDCVGVGDQQVAGVDGSGSNVGVSGVKNRGARTIDNQVCGAADATIEIDGCAQSGGGVQVEPVFVHVRGEMQRAAGRCYPCITRER